MTMTPKELIAFEEDIAVEFNAGLKPLCIFTLAGKLR